MRHIHALFLLSLSIGISAQAETRVSFLASSRSTSHAEASILKVARTALDLENYRDVRVSIINSERGLPDHAVIYLKSKGVHGFSIASIDLDQNQNATDVHLNYQMKEQDLPRIVKPHCPDPSIEFIAFAPNMDPDSQIEQDLTVEVAKAAIAHGLKTVQLLKFDATRQNYLNYMSCPNLKGNFYDGDANPQEFTTVDGVITASDMSHALAGAFRYHVTNIWLACEAYNDPMWSAVTRGSQAQKYAAGVNVLRIGPSDQAAACAMKAALNGNPIIESFEACYKQLDIPADIWGFDGKGSDYFGR